MCRIDPEEMIQIHHNSQQKFQKSIMNKSNVSNPYTATRLNINDPLRLASLIKTVKKWFENTKSKARSGN